MSRVTVDIELNRVEGDLAIEADIEDGVVVDARCVGTLYRGFEQIMVGRPAFDALVITPRVCGICSTAHLYASALALEHAWGIAVPPLATRVRDLGLMAETLQSDLRQTFLMFAPDFVHARYRTHPRQAALAAAFAPFTGRLHRETVDISRKPLEIVALFGGQWPHSSWMVPGGISGRPEPHKAMTSLALVDAVTRWFESSVLGGGLDDWLAIADPDAARAWSDARPDSALGLLEGVARDIGLDRAGLGRAHLLSYGAGFDAEAWRPPYAGRPCRRAAGVLDPASGEVAPFDQALIAEEVAHSWYDWHPERAHPSRGTTVPNYPGSGGKYSWVKAPRYDGKVVQTGALAELAVAGEPLLRARLAAEGDHAWLRQFARLRRAGLLLLDMRALLREILAGAGGDFLNPVSTTHDADGEGFGLLQVARGALGHWVSIRGGRIERYQIVSPTTWNASPRDGLGRPGHWEETLVGTPVADPDDPVEVGHIIRAHDPCLVCSVHFTGSGRRLRVG